LRENISSKGANSYYYAHSRPTNVPANAKTIRGDGIISGGPPQKIEPPGSAVVSDDNTDDEVEALRQEVEDLRLKLRANKPGGVPSRVVHVAKYSFCDDGPKVKIYVELEATLLTAREKCRSPPSLMTGTGGIWSNFTASSAEVHVITMCRKPFWAPNDDAVIKHILKLEPLVHDITPGRCACKVVEEKGRIVLSLRKADPEKIWRQVTTQVMKKAPTEPDLDT
jgi:hypothetical protein